MGGSRCPRRTAGPAAAGSPRITPDAFIAAGRNWSSRRLRRYERTFAVLRPPSSVCRSSFAVLVHRSPPASTVHREPTVTPECPRRTRTVNGHRLTGTVGGERERRTAIGRRETEDGERRTSYRMSPFLTARYTACGAFVALSRRSKLARWAATVLASIPSAFAVSTDVRPFAIS